MLYYFTASDDNAKKHWNDSIANKYNISTCLEDLDIDIVKELKKQGLNEYVNMWGATPGKSNIRNWDKLKPGDKVLAYSKGIFHYYGTIFAKTHNKKVATKVWNIDTEGQTWEYIYFIKDLIKVEITSLQFAAFFGYKLNFFPQGFSHVSDIKLEIKLEQCFSTDAMIKELNEDFILSEEEQEENNYQASIDSDYTNVSVDDEDAPEKKKIPKKNSNRNIWPRDTKKAKQAIKKANYKCEIDPSHTTFISESSKKPYMEAHHLIPLNMQHHFDYNLDVVSNIICLCPNCHRAIHLGKPAIKKEKVEFIYKFRQERLRKSGLSIDLHKLLGDYGVSSKKNK